jgi:hypothetical protein
MEHLQAYQEDVIELSMDPQMARFYADFEETLNEALRQTLAIGDNFLLAPASDQFGLWITEMPIEIKSSIKSNGYVFSMDNDCC